MLAPAIGKRLHQPDAPSEISGHAPAEQESLGPRCAAGGRRCGVCGEQQIIGVLRLPYTAGPVELIADARRRNITCRLPVDAPLNRQTYRARVRWLLNQLPEETALPARLDLIWERSQRSSAPLSSFRDDVNAGRIDSPSAPRAFEIVYVTDLAARFAGSKSFVPALEEALAAFYDSIAQHIRPWQGRVAVEEEAVTEESAEVGEPPPAAEPERKIAKSGQINGRTFSIFDDGSIEIETGNGVQRFSSFAELTAAAAKNGHADAGRNSGRGTAPSF
jgi:hypothetical protein